MALFPDGARRCLLPLSISIAGRAGQECRYGLANQEFRTFALRRPRALPDKSTELRCASHEMSLPLYQCHESVLNAMLSGQSSLSYLNALQPPLQIPQPFEK